jgi:NAD(P)-dependent dehydrogenase (short-subunit alcohol dehydrogenase family)
MNDMKDKVVVITGASSGIGRATAQEFARHGAKVVIAARDNDSLVETAKELKAEGGEVLAVATDVTQEDQVEKLARRAEEAYKHIDIWVNNAGVALFAKFDEAPTDDYRQVIETDFFGYVYGARAALSRFKKQGHGLIVNVDAVEGIAPKPYHSAYAAAKHAVRALASSLRMELALEGFKDINVATVMPSTVDTPLYAHAANYTGKAVQAPGTSSPPAEVAQVITRLVSKPQREVVIGAEAKRSVMQYLMAPNRYERRHSWLFPQKHLSDNHAVEGKGNLYETTHPHTVDGGWATEQPNRMKSAAPWLLATGAVVAVASVTTWLLMPRKQEEQTD